jgi:hypothetical protein
VYVNINRWKNQNSLNSWEFIAVILRIARVYCENEGAKLFWQISYLKSLSNVSIPLRGKGYEKQFLMVCIRLRFCCFHPLAGKRLWKTFKTKYWLFSSYILGVHVSIPLRGKGYEKRKQSFLQIRLKKQHGFHPLAGKRLWKTLRDYELFDFLGCDLFPSPCGEKVMKNYGEYSRLYTVAPNGFPSPCGEKVMKNDK